ncbi:MAG: SUMF1/EgtB/PvdO family nonheme iron enzyme [Ferruginibacter sp.]
MKRITLLAAMFAAFSQTRANDIQLANTGLTNQNTTSHTVEVKFDVNWKNSWRTSTNESNYDGAWIFVKFRKVNTSLWQHCSLNTAGFTAPAGSTVKVSADQKGFWIYASGNEIGDVNYTNGKVVWNYGSNGVLDSDSVEIRVFAVEMVYIPQGSYYLGSGGSEYYHFQDSTSNSPYLVTSEGALNFGYTTGKLFAAGYSQVAGNVFTLPAAYPKGFAAFWIMKYECSQQQYVDFLNNLDLARATNNNGGGFTGTHPNLVAPQPERAYGVVTVGARDWADWGAMRPMTELEYEKACRGANITPLPDEYPWGNTTLVGVSALNNPGTSTESQVAPYGNCNYNNTGVSMRCGLFARPGLGAYRDSAGATYYGVMEMAGNVWEKVIGLYNNANNNAFSSAVHGDGNLDGSGYTDIATWLNSSYMIKGSAWNNAANPIFCKTSDRYYSQVGWADVNNSNIGFRLVRTAE